MLRLYEKSKIDTTKEHNESNKMIGAHKAKTITANHATEEELFVDAYSEKKDTSEFTDTEMELLCAVKIRP